MGCTSSTMRHTPSLFDKIEEAIPVSPSMSSSSSDAPVILESPAAISTCPMKFVTPPPSIHPSRRRLHRRRRQEPHLDHHLTDRLDTLAQYLQKVPRVDSKKIFYAQVQRAIDDLLDTIHVFFSDYENEKRLLWRLAQTGRVVQQVESFHRVLDAITARCGLMVAAPSGLGSSLPRWQSRWRRMRAERLVFFQSYLEDHETVAVSKPRTSKLADQLEVLTLLKHNVQKCDTLLTADESKLLERAYAFVVRCSTNSVHHEAQLHAMFVPEWFVAPYDKTKQQLKWQRAAVIVQSAPEAMNLDECFTLASTWSRLQHPHIMTLFGACHVGRRPFFVVAEGTPLTRCFHDDGFPLWRALYEAAIAVQHLHERRISLSSLSCADLILFRSGDRDSIMLAGFNMKQMDSGVEPTNVIESIITKYDDQDPVLEENASDVSYDDIDMIDRDQMAQVRSTSLGIESCGESAKKYWQAPELSCMTAKGPTEGSDIYALGMCAIEAFSGGRIWNSNESSPVVIPPRPAAMKEMAQWDLVKRMCSYDISARPSLMEVVASFRAFAYDEENNRTCFSAAKPRKKLRLFSLGRTQPRATSVSIACTLSEVQAWCDDASESSAMNYHLFERMDDIAAQLEGMYADDAVSHLPVLADLILRFRDLLQRHVNENSLIRLAATRHIIETNVTFHDELDDLLSKLVSNYSGAAIHSWKLQQASHKDQLWKRLRVTLSTQAQLMSGGLDEDQDLVLLCTLLAFEVKKRRSSYAARDLDLMNAALDKVKEAHRRIVPPDVCSHEYEPIPSPPTWFIPPYEVVCNKIDGISQETSSAVHFGKWMNMDVVVKYVVFQEKHGVANLQQKRRGAHCTSDAIKSSKEPLRQFMNEMTVWSALKHPNVLELLGACHLGQHRFFVCEYAAKESVDIFVASQPKAERSTCARRVLHEMALGLQYLHSQNLVHADLRCCNILVSSKGIVKIADFGLSSIKPRNLSVGANRWTAPECQHVDSSPTFASNVYSFAMCAIEVVSGELPWGCGTSDATVQSNICEGLLPPRPANCFTDSEWSLIQRMCCHDPNERITMSDVIKKL